MRNDAAHALRVVDEPPRDAAELHAVGEAASEHDSRRFGRPSPEATMALRHFERLVDGSAAADLDRDKATPESFTREPRRSARQSDAPRVARRRSGPVAAAPAADLDFDAIAAALEVAEPVREREVAAPVQPKPKPQPVNAPGRAYGSHRRGESPASGHQSGRRTVQITGQAQAPRRPSQTSAAITARPDRVALWAFMFAMFLVVMAIATAHGA
jgi:hypothetical protein